MRKIRINNKKTIMVFSVAVSILLWSYVIGDINPFTTKQLLGVGVEIEETADENLIITSEINPTVDVRISGRRNDIASIRRNDLNFSIDLSEYGEGTHSVEIENRSVIRGDNVTLDYEPKELEVKIERVVSKSFTPEIQTVGNFPSGISLSRLNMSTGSVTATGPRSKVESIARIAANVNVSEISGRQNLNAPLLALDSNGNAVEDITLNRETVRVTVLAADMKSLKVVPRFTGEVPEGYELLSTEIVPSGVSVRVSNGGESVEQIETEPINLSQLREDTNLVVDLTVPENVELLDEKTVSVTLSIRRSESEQANEENSESQEEEPAENSQSQENEESEDASVERELEYPLESVEIENLSVQLRISNLNQLSQNISVKIRGSEQVVESISLQNIDLSLDLSTATEAGEYSIALEGALSDESAEIVQIEPQSLNLLIEPRVN